MELKRIRKIDGFPEKKQVRLTFETDADPLTVNVDADALNDMINFIGVGLGEIRRRGASTGVSQAHQVTSHHTDTSDDGKHILLQLTTRQGFTHGFVFPTTDAATLEAAMHTSIVAAKRAARPPPKPRKAPAKKKK